MKDTYWMYKVDTTENLKESEKIIELYNFSIFLLPFADVMAFGE